MRISVEVDEALWAQALSYRGPLEPEKLIREALVTLVQVEAGRRLADMGGSEPDAESIPRRHGQYA